MIGGVHHDSVDGGFSTETTGAAGVYFAVRLSFSRGRHAFSQHHIHRIALRLGGFIDMKQRSDVIRTIDDTFGPQKTRHQIEVLSRGAHGDGCGLAFDSNFEGLLGRDPVGLGGGSDPIQGSGLYLNGLLGGFCGQEQSNRG